MARWVRDHGKDYGEKEARETSLASNASKVVHASSSSSSEKDTREMALAPRTSKASKKVAPQTAIQHTALSSHAKAQKDSHVEAKEKFKSIAAEQKVVEEDVHHVEREIQNGAKNNAALAPSTAIQHAALAPSLINWSQKHQNTFLWAKKLGEEALVGSH